MLNIQERQNENVTILNLEGDVILGGGSAKLRETLAQLIKDNKINVLLNFQKVRYIDSSGIGEIISTQESFNQINGSLKICNLTPKVEEVLALSSILPILDIYDTETEALNS